MLPVENCIKNQLKLTIITVCYNVENTILDTLNSIKSQTYSNLEFIICDGGSTDESYEKFNQWRQQVESEIARTNGRVMDIVWMNQRSNGIYGAMNEAVSIATGDILTFLNANDVFFHSRVCEYAMFALESDTTTDAVYGNVVVTSENWWQRRYIDSKYWKPWMLLWGFMAPQPGFFIRLTSFNQVGSFIETMRIAADFEWLIRFHYNNGLKAQWVESIQIVMESGGVSSRGFKSWKMISNEMKYSLELNGYKVGIWRLIFRLPIKSIGILRSLISWKNEAFY